MAQQPQDQTGGVTKQKLIELGRPIGPDLQLKFNPNLELSDANAATGGIIRIDSSITEVLNVLSFLISPNRGFDDIVEAENSAATATAAGQIDLATGYYTDAAPAAFQLFPAATFNINDLTVTAGNIHFPVSILKRRGDANTVDPNNPNKFTEGMDAKLVTVATAEGEVKTLFIDCVKQMIYILNKTRTILGPTGWTDLFQKISGGSSANKKAKRTHRHRRRYSSKQY
jgi:hypothetical protein